MTRDECLAVIGALYGSNTIAMSSEVGSWAIRIDSSIPREIILTKKFVATNIDRGCMSPEQFAEYLNGVAESRWGTASGMLTLVLR